MALARAVLARAVSAWAKENPTTLSGCGVCDCLCYILCMRELQTINSSEVRALESPPVKFVTLAASIFPSRMTSE